MAGAKPALTTRNEVPPNGRASLSTVLLETCQCHQYLPRLPITSQVLTVAFAHLLALTAQTEHKGSEPCTAMRGFSHMLASIVQTHVHGLLGSSLDVSITHASCNHRVEHASTILNVGQ